MFKYLIADYILGYCLSTDHPFSAKDIGKELHVPVDSVTKIMKELVRLKGHWFEIHKGESYGDLTMVRKKEYDDEMILWLTKGSSRDHYQLSELRLREDNFFPQKFSSRQKLYFTFAVIIALMKFCTIILVRQYRKHKELLPRYIAALKLKSVKTLKNK